MKYMKKKDLSASEVAQIRRRSDGYIWAVLDVHNNSIVLGDEYLVEMRDDLIYKYHSRPKNIFGIGLDLCTGDISYPLVVNRLNSVYRDNKGVPSQIRDRIETMVGYYFERFDPFCTSKNRANKAHNLQAPSC